MKRWDPIYLASSLLLNLLFPLPRQQSLLSSRPNRTAPRRTYIHLIHSSHLRGHALIQLLAIGASDSIAARNRLWLRPLKMLIH